MAVSAADCVAVAVVVHLSGAYAVAVVAAAGVYCLDAFELNVLMQIFHFNVQFD